MRAEGGGGVAGGGLSADRVHRWSGQCIATESSMRDASQLICNDARDRPFGSIWFHLVPFVFDGLPLVTKRYSGREKCLYVKSKGMCDHRM